jgi:A/G-specific adenine glycosylase
VLVSEIMLQQTQVDRVLPKYEEWLDRYPTFESLAAADDRDVVKTWYPLGYNIRPRRLQAIARESVARFDGRLPDDEATLRSFKGIGAYTAGAVMSFAFGKRAAILDTNVARVLYRVFVAKGDAKSHGMKRHLWSVSEAVLPHRSRVRLQSGADGFGRNRLYREKAEVPRVPDEGGLSNLRDREPPCPMTGAASSSLPA